MDIQANRAVSLVVIPFAHGYRDKVSNQPDERTKTIFLRASNLFLTEKALLAAEGEHELKFAIIKSIVRNTEEGPLWWEIQRDLSLESGVPAGDIIVLERETWNGTMDTLAIAELTKRFPYAVLRVYPWAGGIVQCYFASAFKATSRHFLNLESLNLVFAPCSFYGGISLGTTLQYLILSVITMLTGLNKWTYRAWYNFFNWATSGRVKKFTGTGSFR